MTRASCFAVLFASLLGAAFAVLSDPEDKFDHKNHAALQGGDDCALLSLVVDESGSMMHEHDFLANRTMSELVADYKDKAYDRIFVCSHGFGAARDQHDGYAFHGCVDAAAWSTPATTSELSQVMGSWRTLGGVEDAYLGILKGIENTPGVISGYQLNATCGTMFKNMILLTDEDRDEFNAGQITKGDVKQELADAGFVFNAIVNLDISSPPDQENFEALGFYPSADQPGKFEIFVPNGSDQGTYTTLFKDDYTPYLDTGAGAGSSADDYISLSIETGGAIYDLGMLRLQNADYSEVFVNSLSDTQVREIVASETFSGGVVTNFNSNSDASLPNIPPPPADTTTSETETSETSSTPSVMGDPHFKTWQNEHYEYHGQCDMVLVKDPNFADGLGLDIHIRSKLVRYWSYIHSVAIRIGSDILELQGSADPEDHDFHYWINFEYQGDVETLGGFPVRSHSKKVLSHKNKFEIDLSSTFENNGPKIVISSFKEFLKVEFENASEEAFGNTSGLLGHYKTVATLARDGQTVLNDFTDLGQEWQVIPSDGLIFHETSTPQFPELCIEPEDPRGDRARRLAESSITEETAEAACATLKDPIDQKDCVYDILATQDMDMVGAY